MPLKKEVGYRTSIMVPTDVEKLIKRARDVARAHGYAPLSRSSVIAMALRSFFNGSDWRRLFEKGGSNGQ